MSGKMKMCDVLFKRHEDEMERIDPNYERRAKRFERCRKDAEEKRASRMPRDTVVDDISDDIIDDILDLVEFDDVDDNKC